VTSGPERLVPNGHLMRTHAISLTVLCRVLAGAYGRVSADSSEPSSAQLEATQTIAIDVPEDGVAACIGTNAGSEARISEQLLSNRPITGEVGVAAMLKRPHLFEACMHSREVTLDGLQVGNVGRGSRSRWGRGGAGPDPWTRELAPPAERCGELRELHGGLEGLELVRSSRQATLAWFVRACEEAPGGVE
jgi:hypothetical protein